MSGLILSQQEEGLLYLVVQPWEQVQYLEEGVSLLVVQLVVQLLEQVHPLLVVVVLSLVVPSLEQVLERKAPFWAQVQA